MEPTYTLGQERMQFDSDMAFWVDEEFACGREVPDPDPNFRPEPQSTLPPEPEPEPEPMPEQECPKRKRPMRRLHLLACMMMLLLGGVYIMSLCGKVAVSYTHLTLPTTPYV